MSGRWGEGHHLNRGLVAVDYEVQQTRGKTKSSRRNISLDRTTLDVLDGWRAFQSAEFVAVGIDNSEQWLFTDGNGDPIHPHAIYEAFRRIVHNADVTRIRFHDYADVRAMPTSSSMAWQNALVVEARSA